MILHYFPSLNLDAVTTRQYNSFLEQAFNIAEFTRGGKLSFQSFADKKKQAELEWQIEKGLEGL